MRRHLFLNPQTGLVLAAIIALVIPAAEALGARPFRKSKLPNIVLIVADDLGYGDVGCQGQARIRTPNIDRLAREGMRFTQAYAGSTVCAPSRCALMTGRHTGRCRTRSNVQVPLEPGDVTLGEIARAAGLRTCAVGKWALGWEGTTGHPNRQGFEDWFGFLEQRDAHNHYPPRLWRNETEYALSANAGRRTGEYAPDRFAQVAGLFIQQTADAPFLLYFASTLPHANNELGTNGMQAPTLGPYARETWPAPEKAKAAMISRLDDHVGHIMTSIQKLGLDEDTLVVFTSDNGPHKEGGVDPAFFQSSGPLRGLKRDLYEGGIRVPFIARWPGRIRAGSTNDLPIAFWDLLPTIAELVKVEPPPGLDGISFAPALLGQPHQRSHLYLYWEFHERVHSRALRSGDWKLVEPDAGKPLELYDLRADPGETREISGQHPDVVGRLKGMLDAAAEPFTTPAARAPTPPWDVPSGK